MLISKNKTHLVGTFKFSSWGFYIINKYKAYYFSINKFRRYDTKAWKNLFKLNKCLYD